MTSRTNPCSPSCRRFNGVSFSVGRRAHGVDGHFSKPQKMFARGSRICSMTKRWRRDEHSQGNHASCKSEAGARIDHGLDLAVIGNCKTAALVDPTSRLVWWCFPALRRRSGVLPFARGRRGKGFQRRRARRHGGFQIRLRAQHRHGRNHLDRRARATPFAITDFAPRFRQYGRMFRPPQLFRIIEPIAGLAAHYHSRSPDALLRQAAEAQLARQQPHSLCRGRIDCSRHDRRADCDDRE